MYQTNKQNDNKLHFNCKLIRLPPASIYNVYFDQFNFLTLLDLADACLWGSSELAMETESVI